MANKKAVYSVETKVDTSKAAADAKRLAAIFRAELAKISVGTTANKGASGANSIAAAQTKAAAQAAAITAKASAAAGATATKAAAQAAAIATKASADAGATTTKAAAVAAATASKAAAQQAAAAAKAARPPSTGGGLGSNVSSIAGIAKAGLAGAAGYLTAQAAKQLAETAFAIDDLRTKSLRAEAGFRILSGGAAKAESSIRSIQNASGGTIDRLTALEVGNQALALGLAKTSAQFGELTTAARGVALISPVINDVQGAISELGLASANLSWRRLDQLGLSVGEVRARFKELQATGMEDSAAFLAASVEILNEKYGKLLETQEANASGAEQLRVQWEDLKAALATGPIGNGVDAFFQRIAESIREVQVLMGSGTGAQIGNVFDDLIAKRKEALATDNNFVTNAGVGLGLTASNEELAFQNKLLEEGADIIARLNEGVEKGIPGAAELAAKAAEIAGQVARNDLDSVGTASINVELMGQLQDLDATYNLLSGSVGNYIDIATVAIQTEKAAAEATAKRLVAMEELANEIKDPELFNFAQGMIDQEVGTDFFTTELARMEEFISKRTSLEGQITNGASKLVERFGIPQATAIVNQQMTVLETEFKRFDELNLQGPALDLAIAQLEAGFSAQVDAFISEKDRLEEAANLDGIVSNLSSSLSQLNSGSFDGVEGISAVRDELLALASDVAFSTGATDEQVTRFAYLSAVADSAASSTSAFGQTQAALGVEFLNTNDYVGSLSSEMANLDGALATGAISADFHRSALIELVSAIYAAAVAANASAPALANLLALKNSLLAGGPVNTPDGVRGANVGRSIQQREAIKAGEARREQLRDQQEATAKEAAKGFKSAASSAAKDFNAAAKSTKQAFENAAKTLESALRKVDGLFGNSDVTQKDLDLANAGGSVNKADDWRRRLEDTIKNGKEWAGVSVDKAREALERVGITVGKTNEEVLAQFNQAWSDLSLFADKANLDLINQDAVRQQLQIQDKIKQGQQNILDLFGATVDGVMEGVRTGDKTSIGLVANELAGSDDKQAQEWAKGMLEGKQVIIDKVLAMAQADLQEIGGGGGGGGSGSSLGIERAIDVAPPTELDLNDAVTDWFSKAPPPVLPANMFGPMPNPNAMAGQFGPTALPGMAAFGSLGPVAGPALTVDPATAATYITDLIAALKAPANLTLLQEAGGDLGTSTTEGLKGATFAEHTVSYIAKLSEAFNTPEPAGHAQQSGADLGSVIADGLKNATFATAATAYITKLSTALNAIESYTALDGAGKTIGATIAWGMDNGPFAVQTTAYITALAIEFEKVAGASSAIGKTIGGQIAVGLAAADFTDKTSKYLTALDNAFDVSDKQSGIGKILGGQIAGGLDTAILTTQAEDYLTALDSAFDVSSKQFEIGKVLGGQIAAGLSTADFTESTTAFMSALSSKITPPTEVEGEDGKVRRKTDLMALQTSGGDAAKALDTGFLAHVMGDLAGKYHTDLSAQFSTKVGLFNAVGDGAATFVGQGWDDHDFSAQADSMIADLKAAFKNDSAATGFRSLGAIAAEGAFLGFKETLVGQGWLAAIRDELLSDAMESLATSVEASLNATTEARAQ